MNYHKQSSQEIKKRTNSEVRNLLPLIKDALQMARLEDHVDKTPMSVTKFKGGRAY